MYAGSPSNQVGSTRAHDQIIQNADFNTDQGSQFTSVESTQVLQDRGIRISMDGKGRWVENVFVERLWRSLKYEEVYLNAYGSIAEANRALACTSTSTTASGRTSRSMTG